MAKETAYFGGELDTYNANEDLNVLLKEGETSKRAKEAMKSNR